MVCIHMDDTNSVTRRVSVTHRNFQMSVTKMAELNMTWSSTRYASLSSENVHLCLIRGYKSAPSKASLHFTFMWDQWRAATVTFSSLFHWFFFFTDFSFKWYHICCCRTLCMHVFCAICPQSSLMLLCIITGAPVELRLSEMTLCAVVTSM